MRQAPISLLLLCVLFCTACTTESPTNPTGPEVLAGFAEEIAAQERTLLTTWYQRVVDREYGG